MTIYRPFSNLYKTVENIHPIAKLGALYVINSYTNSYSTPLAAAITAIYFTGKLVKNAYQRGLVEGYVRGQENGYTIGKTEKPIEDASRNIASAMDQLHSTQRNIPNFQSGERKDDFEDSGSPRLQMQEFNLSQLEFDEAMASQVSFDAANGRYY